MTEPTLAAGETWEGLRDSLLRQLDELDVLALTADPWQRLDIKDGRKAIRFQLDCIRSWCDVEEVW